MYRCPATYFMIQNNEPGETGGGGGGGGGSSSEGGARGNYRESRVDSCETISFDSDGASTTPSVVSPLRQVTDMEYTKDQDGALNSLVLNVQFYKALDDLVQNVQVKKRMQAMRGLAFFLLVLCTSIMCASPPLLLLFSRRPE